MKKIKWYWYALAVVVFIILAMIDYTRWHILFNRNSKASDTANVNLDSPTIIADDGLVSITPFALTSGQMAYYKKIVPQAFGNGVLYFDKNKKQITAAASI